MLFRSAFRFCSFNKDLFQRQKPLIQIDNIIKILRPFDIEINIEEMVETVKIVGKYSKHTLYKFPIPQFLQSNSLQIDPKFISETQQRIMKNIPSSPKNLSIFYRMYRYPMRFALPKTVFQISKSLRKSALSEQTLKLAACLENIQIALSLHMMVDRYHAQKPSIFSLERIIYNKLSDKKLVLGGDFFHSKASVLSANIMQQVEVPLFLSMLEEEAAKGVFYEYDLFQKIKENGANSIVPEEVYQLAYHQCASKFAFTTILTYWVQNGDLNKLNDAFKAGVYLGLCIDFQNQMKYFVRNLPTMSNTLLKAVVNNNECNFYQDKIALPIYFMHQKSKETTSLQQLHDHALKQSEKVIEIMSEKSKEYFLKLGADFEDISDLIEHFCRYE
ncbi:unnamed protein product [Paramecium octaurelia]|uniref:Uncharacterized protein n=1 Tax=Paramecium octaurelia TaxID=43137 RepID=A0A8S1SBH5_PAROT|nr:unnamed protein product [Paramecium octaurelia]